MAANQNTGPYSQDILTRIYNVQWGGVFSFAGNILFQIVTDLPDVGSPDDLQVSWLGGTSGDGEKWESGRSQSGLGLFCCVGGRVSDRSATVAAGDVSVTDWAGPGYARAYGTEPAAGVSYDGGQSWNDGGIPLQQFILTPPNPITGAGAHVATGICNAVAYHPASQTFCVGAWVFFTVGADIYWEDRMYSGSWNDRSGTIQFSQVYSERRELFAPFEGYRWPEVDTTPVDFKPGDRLRVADTTLTTKPGPGVLFVVSFSVDQHAEYVTTEGKESYVAVKASGSGATLGGTDGKPPTDLNPPMPVVYSVCGGRGHIVAVGWQDEDRHTGPVTYVSNDDGKLWVQQLSGLINTNPEPEDKNSGSSGGSCSFSPAL
jgi:hypothetical protein